ncbi:MAG: hypothetical protein AVO34_09810 [Firmicutes bacterium ML8_F2]|jgi:hypothetical protein|nr:MAG: hypothetical protein AVO34_09810 [Firmicutes bacterium ML8_F2]
MIYYEEVRQTVFDFVARKLQAQLAEMQEIHPRAFVWVDEPGLAGAGTMLPDKCGRGRDCR